MRFVPLVLFLLFFVGFTSIHPTDAISVDVDVNVKDHQKHQPLHHTPSAHSSSSLASSTSDSTSYDNSDSDYAAQMQDYCAKYPAANACAEWNNANQNDQQYQQQQLQYQQQYQQQQQQYQQQQDPNQQNQQEDHYQTEYSAQWESYCQQYPNTVECQHYYANTRGNGNGGQPQPQPNNNNNNNYYTYYNGNTDNNDNTDNGQKFHDTPDNQLPYYNDNNVKPHDNDIPIDNNNNNNVEPQPTPTPQPQPQPQPQPTPIDRRHKHRNPPTPPTPTPTPDPIPSPSPTPSPSPDNGIPAWKITASSREYHHMGIDVSDYQLSGNYKEIVQYLAEEGGGAQPFVFRKIVDGSTRIQKRYIEDLNGFAKEGAVTGIYIFFRPNQDVQKQFAAVEDHSLHRKIMAVDEEVSGGIAFSEVVQKTKEMLSFLGPSTWLYINNDFYKQMKGIDSQFPWGHHIWFAQPKARKPSVPCLIWQTSWDGHIPGITATAVDLDIWMGTEDQWNEFIVGAAANPVTPLPHTIGTPDDDSFRVHSSTDQANPECAQRGGHCVSAPFDSCDANKFSLFADLCSGGNSVSLCCSPNGVNLGGSLGGKGHDNKQHPFVGNQNHPVYPANWPGQYVPLHKDACNPATCCCPSILSISEPHPHHYSMVSPTYFRGKCDGLSRRDHVTFQDISTYSSTFNVGKGSMTMKLSFDQKEIHVQSKTCKYIMKRR